MGKKSSVSHTLKFGNEPLEICFIHCSTAPTSLSSPYFQFLYFRRFIRLIRRDCCSFTVFLYLTWKWGHFNVWNVFSRRAVLVGGSVSHPVNCPFVCHHSYPDRFQLTAAVSCLSLASTYSVISFARAIKTPFRIPDGDVFSCDRPGGVWSPAATWYREEEEVGRFEAAVEASRLIWDRSAAWVL